MKKKKRKSKFGRKIVFILAVEPYVQDCVVVINGQLSDAIKELKKHKTKNSVKIQEYYAKHKEEFKDDYEIGNGKAFLVTEMPVGYIMLLSHQSGWVRTTGLVVHECLHLVHYVLHRAGLKLSPDSEEAYTYLLEDLVEKILAKIY